MIERSNQPRILIVDDVPANIKILAELLKEDYDISMTTDGRDALRIALIHKFDLILLDIVMPGLDGYEVCRCLHENPQTKGIPVIFVTGQGETENEELGLTLGAVDYIIKPFSAPIVLARIKTHLGLKFAREQIEKNNQDITALNNSLVEVLAEQKKMNNLLDRANQFIRTTFGRYMSEDVVNTILNSPNGLRLGGEKREVTVLMSDLRGFTLLSEQRSPEDVVLMLNLYLEAMTEILIKYHGTIIEFMGDGILALFGAPSVGLDDPQRAVACALEMQQAMSKVNARNRAKGFPEFMMGIGLNTGLVVAGNIGSDKRTKYGVVGSSVNLAARIESLTVGGQILISDATAKACGPILSIDQSWEVMPKGVGRPIMIHQVSGITGPYVLQLAKPEKIALRVLDVPLKVRIHVMEGKHAGQAIHVGTLNAIAPPLAEMVSSLQVERLTNLRIELFDLQNQSITNQLYAKVITEDEGDGRQTIHFTATPPEAELLFQQLLGLEKP
ncbi:MAG: response regulator [Magnetococcales bacterium]|nr:response regulator [Magnetococcales bacterium]MBF0437980.1 response regulator [Magnetococcales bacterium]